MLHCEETPSNKVKAISLDQRPLFDELLLVLYLFFNSSSLDRHTDYFLVVDHFIELSHFNDLLLLRICLIRFSDAIDIAVGQDCCQGCQFFEGGRVGIGLERVFGNNYESLTENIADRGGENI